MLFDLRTLKPDPMRDFIVDPIDEARVASLVRDGYGRERLVDLHLAALVHIEKPRKQ